MVIPFIAAKDEVYRRLSVIFDPEIFRGLCDYQAPKVFDRYPVNEPPFYVAVDEIVETASTDAAVSMGHATIGFPVNVLACAQHSDLITASNTLMAYINTIFAVVLADQTLGRSVDNSFPSIETAGTAADGSKRYLAAARISINCTVFSKCPREIKEALDAHR